MPTTDNGEKGIVTVSFVDSLRGSDPTFATERCGGTEFNCPYNILVLANDTGNELENDRSSILGMFEEWTTSATFAIQKFVGGFWIDQTVVSDSSYGVWYPMGSFDSKPKYAGFIADWSLIRPAFGDGLYRFRVNEVNPIYPMGNDRYSQTYCLKEYNCKTPENTVRLEWYQNGGIGDVGDDTRVLDFADINWFNQFRLDKAIFGYPVVAYETEETQYTNGAFEVVKDRQFPTYTLTLGLLPAFMHDILRTYALMSGTLTITDYSSNNPETLVRKAVKKKSGYEPRWTKQNKCAPVTVELEQRINNLETFRCR